MALATRAKALLIVGVALIVLVGLTEVYLISYLASAHTQRLHDQQQLACLLVERTPPGNDLGDEIRSRYDCPPYAQAVPVPAPSSTRPTARRSSTPAARKRTTPTSSATPGAERPPLGTSGGAKRSQANSGPRAAPTPRATTRRATVTRTARPPARTVTKTRTASPPPSPKPTGPLDPLCDLLPFVCGLLGG